MTKSKIDYNHIIQYIILGGLYFCVLLLLIHPASGEVVRIDQGSDVYLNGTYDIAGVTGWANLSNGNNYIVWYGGYGYYDDSKIVVLKLPIKTYKEGSESQYHFWINPEYFGNKTGYWFQQDGTSDDKHGNTVAFRVIAAYENITTVTNHTINTSVVYVEGNVSTTKIKQGVLPERPVSDYLITRGDPFVISIFQPEKIWIFGRNGNVYDYDTFGKNVTLDRTVTQSLEPGQYYILHQYPGINSQDDVRYSSGKLQWKSDWSGIQNIDISGSQPLLVKNQIATALSQTDDTYFIQKAEVEEPTVTIEGFTEVPMPSTYTGYEYYRLNNGVVSLF